MTIIVAALTGVFGLTVGLMTKGARAASSRADFRERNLCADEGETVAPTLDIPDLPVHPPAIGRARVYYTSHPGIDILEAVLAGLRRL